jgi:hypothetical protein
MSSMQNLNLFYLSIRAPTFNADAENCNVDCYIFLIDKTKLYEYQVYSRAAM